MRALACDAALAAGSTDSGGCHGAGGGCDGAGGGNSFSTPTIRLRRLPMRHLATSPGSGASGANEGARAPTTKPPNSPALNINAVVHALLEYSHCRDWRQALTNALGCSQRGSVALTSVGEWSNVAGGQQTPEEAR